ncbi:NACHT domain-containing protein [Streptomyces sp. MB09-01]|uniref:NACHT domain-containing protein n=1 Tax=Streptomyces sp. MB09-01 TaxID=3028666 RepID=UPI0029BDC7C5|nr:NACHT domain-containing protein [Streptomyces sp. MB09-01]MDX3539214.1 NACHT domain-containing protein [Streptomyces sp. MB09-01]
MTGIETVLLRVAGTAATTLLKSLLARAPGAGLTADPARPVPAWRRPAAELGPPEVRRLTETLAARLADATARLPEHERLAALDAVGDAFAALGPLDAEALFAAELDPEALAATLPPPPPGLSQGAQALCGRLSRLCCEHTVEYATTLPGFGARADVELVRRTGKLTRSVERLERLDRGADGAAYAFEERYARYMAEEHGRLQLFGVTLGQSRQDWPLDLAYISLAVSAETSALDSYGFSHSTQGKQVRIEQTLSVSERILLRGAAGSGKSTVVQWLALNAARRTFGPGLESWNVLVPFVLRLRSFTSAKSLPMPGEFLAAAGVPLPAPEGWVEGLLESGRALILVDGVDEVPLRLRKRTEVWLRSLITAYPQARYVVTTRPSAVPEDWLSRQDFTHYSLLPMEREDIRAFIAQWHASARAECSTEEERAQLHSYAGSLMSAVGTRRDLSRLATNPLMCALLCALNRDRRMHLPRARKELYDAALEMLLVRRDTEREISAVEGVYLTRDEQILLLQRFAYWLIRNGQAETSIGEVVGLVDGWLELMPQVRAQGTAEQVVTHLLIRSGLLREPTKGSVTFVHRTFQDYLGAKAAVEARDFGVLVRHTHDDTWDDVVRMAVGHARSDERAEILRRVLDRAAQEPDLDNRLVLLAATCLEHSPELAPDVRHEIETRAAQLVPPRTFNEAEELARAGGLTLELLPGPDEVTEPEAAAVIRTAALIGGAHALQVIGRFRDDVRLGVMAELNGSWGRFKAQDYADTVLSGASLTQGFLNVRTARQLAALPRLRHILRLRLTGDHQLTDEVVSRENLLGLQLSDNGALVDLAPLRALERLEYLSLESCRSLFDLSPLCGTAVQRLFLTRMPGRVALEPLRDLARLTLLGLDSAWGHRCVGTLPAPEGLTGLWLVSGGCLLDLDGLDRWPRLSSLTVSGNRQAGRLAKLPYDLPLAFLQVTSASELDLTAFTRYRGLRELFLAGCSLASGLEALAELPELAMLTLSACDGPLDLAPLAGLEKLQVVVHRDTPVRGTHALAPTQLTYAGA